MTAESTNETVLRIQAVGDLLLCGRYDAMADDGRAADVFSRLPASPSPSTIRLGNSENPLADCREPRADKLCLRGNPAYADALAAAGFDLVSLANNHVFDYGPDAFEETTSALKASNVGFLRVGEDLAAARQPLIIDRDGVRVAFLAACHASTKPSDVASESHFGIAPLDAENLLADIAHWRGQVDHLVLLLYWGLEYSALPTPDQVQLAHDAIDAGAGLIIGHHSDMLQGVEEYKGAVIAYSPSACTDDRSNAATALAT